MRVTKTIREYIEKKVTEKIYPRYEAEKFEAKRQKDAMDNFFNELAQELETIATERVNNFIKENPFAVRTSKQKITSYYSYSMTIADSHSETSVHNWVNRAKMEVKEKVNDIIVTLELGGNKEDLEKMISEI